MPHAFLDPASAFLTASTRLRGTVLRRAGARRDVATAILAGAQALTRQPDQPADVQRAARAVEDAANALHRTLQRADPA
jgi:hypothetical protein